MIDLTNSVNKLEIILKQKGKRNSFEKPPQVTGCHTLLKIFSVSVEMLSIRLTTCPEKKRFNHDCREFCFMRQCLSMLSQIQHPIFQINHPQIFTFIGEEGNSFEDPIKEFNGIFL